MGALGPSKQSRETSDLSKRSWLGQRLSTTRSCTFDGGTSRITQQTSWQKAAPRSVTGHSIQSRKMRSGGSSWMAQAFIALMTYFSFWARISGSESSRGGAKICTFLTSILLILGLCYAGSLSLKPAMIPELAQVVEESRRPCRKSLWGNHWQRHGEFLLPLPSERGRLWNGFWIFY